MGFNMFKNLTRLVFSLCTVRDCDLLSLTALFQSCPLLQEFHLHTNIYETDRPQGKKQPVVLHSELKKVEFSGFMGMENDIEFALYILESAIGLEEMYITRGVNKYMGFGLWNPWPKTPWGDEKRKTILEQLQGQAVSKTARVVIQDNARIHDWIPAEEDCYNEQSPFSQRPKDKPICW
ncbi:hypothetical protein ACP275_03G112200 [Erythranthe tilingii]